MNLLNKLMKAKDLSDELGGLIIQIKKDLGLDIVNLKPSVQPANNKPPEKTNNYGRLAKIRNQAGYYTATDIVKSIGIGGRNNSLRKFEQLGLVKINRGDKTKPYYQVTKLGEEFVHEDQSSVLYWDKKKVIKLVIEKGLDK